MPYLWDRSLREEGSSGFRKVSEGTERLTAWSGSPFLRITTWLQKPEHPGRCPFSGVTHSTIVILATRDEPVPAVTKSTTGHHRSECPGAAARGEQRGHHGEAGNESRAVSGCSSALDCLRAAKALSFEVISTQRLKRAARASIRANEIGCALLDIAFSALM